jgi:hypothetical protein
MPDVQEVFRMATQKVRPEPGALDRQLHGQRRRTVRRKTGAVLVSGAVIAAVVALAVMASGDQGRERRLGGDGRSISPLPIPPPMENGGFTIFGLQHGMTELAGTDERWLVRCGRHCTTIRDAARTLDVATGEERRLLAGERFWALDWSSDGRRIAYVSEVDGLVSILEIEGADGVTTRRVPGIRGANSVSWSPDGTRLAYSTGQEWSGRSGEMFVASIDGSNVTSIGQGHAPVWSPDGSRLAYRHGCEIWVASGDGSSAHLIAEITFGTSPCRPTWFGGSMGPTLGPVWSPDGTKIAIVARRSLIHGGTLFVMNADGGDLRIVAEELPRPQVAVTWRPVA